MDTLYNTAFSDKNLKKHNFFYSDKNNLLASRSEVEILIALASRNHN